MSMGTFTMAKVLKLSVILKFFARKVMKNLSIAQINNPPPESTLINSIKTTYRKLYKVFYKIKT